MSPQNRLGSQGTQSRDLGRTNHACGVADGKDYSNCQAFRSSGQQRKIERDG